MVYRNRISNGNSLKIFLTVAVFSIIGIGAFSYFINPSQPEETTQPEPITYTASSPSIPSQTQTNVQSNADSQIEQKSTIVDISSLEQQIHSEINNMREQSRLQPLKFDQNIVNIATEHSKDMAINNYFDHTSPDGKTVQNRFYDAKYPCNPGENIEQAVVGDSPHSIVQLWMSSSGHEANILQNIFTVEGIGIYQDGQSLFITEDFC